VELCEADGISTVLQRLQKGSPDENVFLFVDPYNIFQENIHGINSLELFVEATMHYGVQGALWFGFDTSVDRDNKMASITKCFISRLQQSATLQKRPRVWYGEIAFVNIDHMTVNPGVPGGENSK